METPSSHPRPRVVIAEDDHLVRMTIVDALRDEGCEVTVSRNGAALNAQLGVMMAVSEAPALVIADDRMPGSSGLAVLERAREWGWTMPMMLITGFADEEVASRARHVSAHVLEKPLEVGTIRSLARAMLRGQSPRCTYCGSTFDLRPVAAVASEFLCAHCRSWWDDEATDPSIGEER